MDKLIDKFWDWALGDAAQNQEPYYEEADLDWVTGVLPLTEVSHSISCTHCGGEAAMDKLGPEWAKFKFNDKMQVYAFLHILPRHMDTLDPEGTSAAYKMLEEWDPEFRKIKIIGKMYPLTTPEFPKELYDLKYLESWLYVNVMTRFSQVNLDLVEEATPILLETEYFKYYQMVIEEGKTLGDVRAHRLRTETLNKAIMKPTWILPLI
ncbi:hypothetical protein LB507_011316 [Fusarium sp. FIESC RH6]|nr:hypothetical protein LB507_011316 [Fusarium sp. FIESC RH6]